MNNYKQSLLWIAIILILASNVTAQEIEVDRSTVSIENILTLNEDGSVSSEVIVLERLHNVPDDLVKRVISLAYKVEDSKNIQNIEIVDLNDPSLKPFGRTSDLDFPDCEDVYSIDFNTNTINVCAKLRSSVELHHKISFIYLQELTCIEKERVRQDIPLLLKRQEQPYSVRISTRANEKVDYLAPDDCFEDWEKSDIPNGIMCINDLFYLEESIKDVVLTFPLTGDVKAKVGEQQAERDRIKNAIEKIVVLLVAILAFVGWWEKLKVLQKNKPIIFYAGLIIIVILYGFYLLY